MKDSPDHESFIENDKTGTVGTTTMHIICAIVGIGILALPSAMKYLGWIAGPIMIVVFFMCALLSARLLSNMYLIDGKEYSRYHHVVRALLGQKSAIALSFFQMSIVSLVMVAYTITGAQALQSVANIACSYEGKSDDEIADSSSCLGSSAGGVWKATLIFAAASLLLSQIRNLEEAAIISLVGTVSSFVYSLISIILSFANLNGAKGTIDGVTGISTANKVFGIFNALGAVSSSFSVSLVLLEIQSTLREPPNPIKQMKRAIDISLSVTFLFYMLVSVSGYASQGNAVADLILDSFTSPRWALLIAYIAILIHMITSYQIFAQTTYESIESHLKWMLIQRSAKMQQAGHSIKTARLSNSAKAPKQSKKTEAEDVESKVVDNTSSPFYGIHQPKDAGLSSEEQQPCAVFGYDHTCVSPLNEMMSTSMSTEIDQVLVTVSNLGSLHSKSGKGGLSKRKSYAGLTSMYSVDTGFANEEVPLNEHGVFVPFYIRLIERSIVVLVVALIACIMPFFSAFVGLLGACTFFPLAIYFPFACYRKRFHVGKGFGFLLNTIWIFMLIISIVAVIGSVRTIIVGWSTYQIFGG